MTGIMTAAANLCHFWDFKNFSRRVYQPFSKWKNTK